jgi:predicted TPR repeat methyltransferase
VLAADVFVYCAEFHAIAATTAAVLALGGLFAFTVESHDGAGVVLRETLRYAHSADHVRAALERAGLDLMALDPASKRTEKGVPVSGLVVVAGGSKTWSGR